MSTPISKSNVGQLTSKLQMLARQLCFLKALGFTLEYVKEITEKLPLLDVLFICHCDVENGRRRWITRWSIYFPATVAWAHASKGLSKPGERVGSGRLSVRPLTAYSQDPQCSQLKSWWGCLKMVALYVTSKRAVSNNDFKANCFQARSSNVYNFSLL